MRATQKARRRWRTRPAPLSTKIRATVSATKPLNVAIVGLGSIGGVVAACLAATGRHNVIACMRKPIGKLTFDGPNGTTDVALPVLTDPAKAEPVNWVLLCTKTHQTESAAPWLARL